MFSPTDRPRVFALPPGPDFPGELVDGLARRLAGQRPDAMARVKLIVNTRRMARRIRDIFDAGPPSLLPRISLVTDLGDSWMAGAVPSAVPALRRRLELAQLISRLMDAQPDLAARASLYDLADSLAGLMDEMQGEGVSPRAIHDLDVSDMSGHWARTQQFIGIVDEYVGGDPAKLDIQARQRKVTERLIDHWNAAPPDYPVILAGSTGSRGTTLKLMEAVSRLPQGAVVLPGFDFDLPDAVWQDMNDALISEDHPQFRFQKVMQTLAISVSDVGRWTDARPPSPERNKLISLALRPAPFTDAWLQEGPALAGLGPATNGISLVEAPGPRVEAQAIAMRLRDAAEKGQTAALITPDRMLTRRVSAALDRWNILPDDSAGLPLQLSPPGRFLRHVARLFSNRLNAEQLMTLLKHPLCHSGSDRGTHLLNTRDLELYLRRHGPPFPDAESLLRYQTGQKKDTAADWLMWISHQICGQMVDGPLPLADWTARLMTAAQSIAAGSQGSGSGGLWEKNAGQKALAVIESLDREAAFGGQMTAQEFGDLLGALLAGEEVRDRDAPHPHILIWGTLEARVQGADLLILGGLNEGSWPEAPQPDPWLNRKLRLDAGLLLPERRIGLSAHDFQQAVAANEVWLTRSVRSDDAETVASRWLSRIVNLLSGLPGEGAGALDRMRARGQVWLNRVATLEKIAPTDPARRPAPKPPVDSRPRRLSVTEIKRLIRDPYAVYAKHVLRLKPLDPLVQEPTALLRGIVVHDILERFVRDSALQGGDMSEQTFLALGGNTLQEKVPWPLAQRFWLARLRRIAAAFVQAERMRQAGSTPLQTEADGLLRLDSPEFSITGRADRIDRADDGTLRIYDYKTGRIPTKAQQANFDKQLLIEAAMAERGCFDDIAAAPVSAAVFLGLGSKYEEVDAPLDDEPPETVVSELTRLIAAVLSPDYGFTSRRRLHKDTDAGDYDHLARYGEWERSDTPAPEDLT